MVVYVDIVFLTNFALDFAMLAATAKLRGIKPAWWRVGLASAIGASYVLLLFVPSLTFLYTFVVKCLFSIGLIMTAFGYKSFPRFVGTLAAFYAVNFAAAGMMLGLHYALQQSHDVWNGILFTQAGGVRHSLGVSLWLILFAGAGSVLLTRSVHTSAKRAGTKQGFIADVEVTMNGDIFSCKGLIDTGNHLYDPLTRTPVMVMETRLWQERLPASWIEAIRGNDPDRILGTMELAATGDSGAGGEDHGAAWSDRVRLVPYRGISGHTKFMFALKPDAVTIRQGDQRIEVAKALIGLDGGTLSSDGSYQAIIHPAMVH